MSAERDTYRRDDWWGKDDEECETTGHAVPQEGPPPGYDQDLASWKAHRILKDTARKLCGLSVKETGEKIELSDPAVCPPGSTANRGFLRYNPKRGYMNGPYDTWVKIEDRPRKQFMLVVESCIDLWQQNHSLSDRGADALRSKAGQLKSNPDFTDEEIVTDLILAVIAPVPVPDYSW